MEPHDLSVEILKSIRDEVKQTNSRLDELSQRVVDEVKQTNSRLEEMREDLAERIVHSEIRTATAITELAGTVREMTQILKSSVELRPRVERCEQDIAELRDRLDRVEPG